MKVSEAIEHLQRLLKKHGDIDVLFDCAHCGKVTRPTVCVAEAAWREKADSK
jgi:uncharacterized Zn finger protein